VHPVSIVRLPIFEIIEVTVTHQSKILTVCVISDLFVFFRSFERSL